jgi:hypothetical protein
VRALALPDLDGKARAEGKTEKTLARRSALRNFALLGFSEVPFSIMRSPGAMPTKPRSPTYSPPQIFMHHHYMYLHVDLPHAAWWASDTILTPLRGDLCTILHPTFAEFPFHALR